MRVVMYVQNDVVHDSRVRREAESLAAVGHEVTVIGISRGHETEVTREAAGSYSIIRIPWRRGTAWWVTLARGPWALVPLALRSAWRSALSGPRAWPRSFATLAFVVLVSPWIVVRTAWYGIVNKILGRPVAFGGLLYIRRWRAEVLPWDRAAVAAAPPADIHHAHDLEALPAAVAAARRDGSRYVYDSHEIFMEWGSVLSAPFWLRWLFGAWERRMARSAAAVVTINESIAADLVRRLQPNRLAVVHNCPPRWQPPDVPEDRIRQALRLAPGTPIVLCHGGFSPNRGLEETAEAMTGPGLERAHLVFLGYRAVFLEHILNRTDLHGRIHYLPAVPPEDVPAWVAGADVDVMAILPNDLNSRLSTPNKLFESLAAGTPVVSSDLPERRRIILDEAHGPLGVLCDPTDPRAIARAIRAILEAPPEERAAMRARCLRAAHDRWNWETQSAQLLQLYEELAATDSPVHEVAPAVD